MLDCRIDTNPVMNNTALFTPHTEAAVLNGQGPLTGLAHQTLAGTSLGTAQTSLWQHHMTAPLVVPPHYHDTEETVVVLSGCLRFQIGPSADDYVSGGDPLAGADVFDCGPDATCVIPARCLHGYEIIGIPARVLIFMPDAQGMTRLPGGDPMPLPWHS